MLDNITAPFEHMMQMMITNPSTAFDHMHVSFNAISAADQEAYWWAFFVAPFIPYGMLIWIIFLIYTWFMAEPAADSAWLFSLTLML